LTAPSEIYLLGPSTLLATIFSRFPKGFGRGRKRHRGGQSHPFLVVNRHDEASLPREIKPGIIAQAE
jgi:hypothetical protein